MSTGTQNSGTRSSGTRTSSGGSRRSGSARGASSEQRAEELMERVGADVSRQVSRFLGRAREELEDIVAEARSLNARGRRRGRD